MRKLNAMSITNAIQNSTAICPSCSICTFANMQSDQNVQDRSIAECICSIDTNHRSIASPVVDFNTLCLCIGSFRVDLNMTEPGSHPVGTTLRSIKRQAGHGRRRCFCWYMSSNWDFANDTSTSGLGWARSRHLYRPVCGGGDDRADLVGGVHVVLARVSIAIDFDICKIAAVETRRRDVGRMQVPLGLQMSGQSSIRTLSGAIAFATMSSTAGTCTGMTSEGGRRLLRNLNDFNTVTVSTVRHAHFIETILIRYMRVVEPRTITRLPGCSANHAELSCTTAVER